MGSHLKKFTLKLYEPHSVQLAMHESDTRFKVFAAGRQVGKSTFCNMEMLKKAWENPNTRYAFISPIFSQAKEQYRRLFQCIPFDIVKKHSDSELRVELINNSVMEYLSGDNPHSLRGKTLNGVLIDEVRDQSPDLWAQVVRPMIATTNGWAIFSSTPAGFNAFYDLAQKCDVDPDWKLFRGPSTCNPLFTQEEFERLKSEMSEALFAQEILGEFRDLTAGRAYQNFSDANIKEQNPFAFGSDRYSPHLPIVIGLDFNVGSMAWTLGQHKVGQFYWADEIWVQNTNTQECAYELVERVRSHPSGVLLCGDATGESRNTKATESDYAIIINALRSANIKCENRTPTKNPPVKERVNNVNAKLKAADGSVHMWISPRCVRLIKDLQRVVWKQGAQTILDQTTDPLLTHSSDGIGYAVHALSPITQSGNVGTLRVLLR